MNPSNRIAQMWLNTHQPNIDVVNDQYMIWKEYPDYVVDYIKSNWYIGKNRFSGHYSWEKEYTDNKKQFTSNVYQLF